MLALKHELLGKPSSTERQLSTKDILTNFNQFESSGPTLTYIPAREHCRDDDVFTSMAWQGYEHWFHAHVSHAMWHRKNLIPIFLSG